MGNLKNIIVTAFATAIATAMVGFLLAGPMIDKEIAQKKLSGITRIEARLELLESTVRDRGQEIPTIFKLKARVEQNERRNIELRAAQDLNRDRTQRLAERLAAFESKECNCPAFN